MFSHFNMTAGGGSAWLRLGVGVLVLGGLLAGGAGAESPLTTAREVRSLTPEEAAQKRPVVLRGTVVFIEGPNGAVVIQDDTAGTFFYGRNERTLRIGDAVEVRGTTTPGTYLPGVELGQYERRGSAELPPALPATYADFATGRYFFQRVVVEGLVQAVRATPDEGRSILLLGMGEEVLEVRICAPPEDRPLVDSRVRLECLASGGINQRRQMVQPIAWMHDWSGLQVLEPALAVEAVPLLTGSRLLSFGAAERGGHRVRVAGVVIAAFPDGEVFLRDETTALRLQLQRPVALPEGTRVEVIGFPVMERFSASVVHASVLRQEAGEVVPPVEASLTELLDGRHDHDLVRVSGEVSGTFQTEAGLVLMLQEGGRSIRALVPPLAQELAPGTRVRVAGICRVESNTASGVTSTPRTVSLRSRTAGEVEVLRAPSWWTVPRLLRVAGGLLLAVLLAVLWITLLRRQVRGQTRRLRQQIEHEAALEERQRLAREFHDTLEQGLTGLALRLDTAQARNTDEKSGRLLQASRRLVAQIHEETRSLVSSLRQPCRERLDLGAELRQMVEEHAAAGGVPALELQAEPGLPALPSHLVHHLKMIAREAVTNALKHARARHIRLGLGVREGVLRLTIADDGEGFDSAAPRGRNAVGFGRTGIEERCEKLGAEVGWTSAPGRGTVVAVTLPLPGQPAVSPALPT